MYSHLSGRSVLHYGFKTVIFENRCSSQLQQKCFHTFLEMERTEIPTSPREWWKRCFGPQRRVGAQHAFLNLKRLQSEHKDPPQLPNSPSLPLSAASLSSPPPPASPESRCTGTARGTCVAPRGPAPSKPAWWSPLSQAQWFPRKHKRCPCPLLAYLLSLSTPPCHPSPGWCQGLRITSRAGETFHAPLKHPESPSPGRPETLFQNGLPLLSQVGNRSTAPSKRTSACNREEKNARCTNPLVTTTRWKQT